MLSSQGSSVIDTVHINLNRLNQAQVYIKVSPENWYASEVGSTPFHLLIESNKRDEVRSHLFVELSFLIESGR